MFLRHQGEHMPDVWTSREAELQGSPRKSKQKQSVYKLYEIRNFWAVSERNTAQTGVLKREDVLASILVGLHPGRGKGEAPGTSGPNVHKAPSLSQSLTSYCFVHSACLTSYSTGTSFHGRQHNQRQFQGHSSATKTETRFHFPAGD